MLRLMTYNIGGNGKIVNSVIKVISNQTPNVLVLNEIPLFDFSELQKISERIKLPYFNFAKSSKSNNHTAMFSSFHFRGEILLNELHNAGVLATVETTLGDVSIAGVHLAQNTEDTRLNEIEKIISLQKGFEKRIILGDLNSISPENIVLSKQLGDDLSPITRHDVISRIRESGYFDVAVETGKEQVPTVPTTQDGNIVFYNLRLDYAFLSNSFRKHRVEYDVVVNDMTHDTSDHFPITVTIT